MCCTTYVRRLKFCLIPLVLQLRFLPHSRGKEPETRADHARSLRTTASEVAHLRCCHVSNAIVWWFGSADSDGIRRERCWCWCWCWEMEGERADDEVDDEVDDGIHSWPEGADDGIRR